jgi:hypothetical protein
MACRPPSLKLKFHDFTGCSTTKQICKMLRSSFHSWSFGVVETMYQLVINNGCRLERLLCLLSQMAREYYTSYKPRSLASLNLKISKNQSSVDYVPDFQRQFPTGAYWCSCIRSIFRLPFRPLSSPPTSLSQFSLCRLLIPFLQY